MHSGVFGPKELLVRTLHGLGRKLSNEEGKPAVYTKNGSLFGSLVLNNLFKLLVVHCLWHPNIIQARLM